MPISISKAPMLLKKTPTHLQMNSFTPLSHERPLHHCLCVTHLLPMLTKVSSEVLKLKISLRFCKTQNSIIVTKTHLQPRQYREIPIKLNGGDSSADAFVVFASVALHWVLAQILADIASTCPQANGLERTLMNSGGGYDKLRGPALCTG